MQAISKRGQLYLQLKCFNEAYLDIQKWSANMTDDGKAQYFMGRVLNKMG